MPDKPGMKQICEAEGILDNTNIAQWYGGIQGSDCSGKRDKRKSLLVMEALFGGSHEISFNSKFRLSRASVAQLLSSSICSKALGCLF